MPRIRTNLTQIDIYYLFSGVEWTCHHYHHIGCAIPTCLGSTHFQKQRTTFRMEISVELQNHHTVAANVLRGTRRGYVDFLSLTISLSSYTHGKADVCEKFSCVTHVTSKLFWHIGEKLFPQHTKQVDERGGGTTRDLQYICGGWGDHRLAIKSLFLPNVNFRQ